MNSPLNLLKSINRFSETMYKKLLKNASKSHWSSPPCNRKFLIEELEIRLDQLKNIYPGENDFVESFSDKCADIANFAMMLSDNYQKRRYDPRGEFDLVSDGQAY